MAINKATCQFVSLSSSRDRQRRQPRSIAPQNQEMDARLYHEEESTPLINGSIEQSDWSRNARNADVASSFSTRVAKAWMCVCALLFGFLILIDIKHWEYHKEEILANGSSPCPTPAPTVAVVSFEQRSSFMPTVAPVAASFGYSFGNKIIEPHRESIFQAQCDECDDDLWYAEWYFGSNATTARGRSVTFNANQTAIPPIIQITLLVYSRDGALIGKVIDHFVIKYVRREIRRLPPDEKDAILDSMLTVYNLPTSEGEDKFGHRFKNIAYFVAKHLAGSASKTCDHWHDDAGMMNHHAGLTLEFEQAMQAVNPKVALPYWDFTIDAHSQQYDGIPWYDSVVFSNDWFGPASSARPDHGIESSRWALTPMLEVQNSEEYPIHNPHGLLRSPWNMNPSRYVTRSADNILGAPLVVNGKPSLPSCKAYMNCFLSPSISVMNECLNGATHGSMHVEVGGIWDWPTNSSIIDIENRYELLLISKNLWRQGFIICPESCADSDPDQCRCTFNYDAAQLASSYEVLISTGVIQWIEMISESVVFDDSTQLYKIIGLSIDEQNEAWDALLYETLSQPGNVGEMYSSASPWDPTFWIIHGTAERLLHWRRLVGRGQSPALPFDSTWGYNHSTEAASDTQLICNWTNVDQGSAALPTCEVRALDSQQLYP